MAVADIKKGVFGNASALENVDFQDSADYTALAFLGNQEQQTTRYKANLDNARDAINLSGRTQLRMHFATRDDNYQADWLGFYSSDNSNSARHPTLTIEYTQPQS